MFCTNCGKGLPEGSQLCDKCGASLTIQSNPVITNKSVESPDQAIVQPEAQQVPGPDQVSTQNTSEGKGWKQLTALILGIISLFLWILPVLGFILAITGLIISIMGVRTPKKVMPILGLVFCSIALLLSLFMTITFSIGFIQGFSEGLSGDVSMTSFTLEK